MKNNRRLRELLAQPNILVAPGVVDAINARLVEEAGFSAVYATGAGIANAQFALPDIGLLSFGEMIEQVRRIVQAVNIPVIADADEGYGSPLNVRRTVQEYEQAGVSAIQIEDQASPKKCGHFDGKEVIPAEEMVQKIRAAVDARDDPDLVLIARTDSLATDGYAEAVRRARLYAASGADVIFVEAPVNREEIELLPQDVRAPMLFNLTEGAKSPDVNPAELQQFGYKMVIFPNTLLRISMRAVQSALAVLKTERSSRPLIPRMMSWDERQRVVHLSEYQKLDEEYSKT
jgi:2-methylisocitrate lyase-like PEP mutase family enzyme